MSPPHPTRFALMSLLLALGCRGGGGDTSTAAESSFDGGDAGSDAGSGGESEDDDVDDDEEPGWAALCGAGPAVFDVSLEEPVQIATDTLVGDLEQTELGFCAGHDYFVAFDVDGAVTLESSDGDRERTVLRPADGGSGVSSVGLSVRGFTVTGFSDLPLNAGGGALVVEDVVLADNDTSGSIYPYLVLCSFEGCWFSDSLITRNDSGGAGLINVSAGGAGVHLDGVDIVDNTGLEMVDDPPMVIRGGSIRDNVTSQAILDDSDCGGAELIDVLAAGNQSLREFDFLQCNCGGGVEMSDAEGVISASCSP